MVLNLCYLVFRRLFLSVLFMAFQVSRNVYFAFALSLTCLLAKSLLIYNENYVNLAGHGISIDVSRQLLP